MVESILFQIGLPGGPEVLIVLFLILLLFGASRIPKVARAGGQAVGEFRKARQKSEQESGDTSTTEGTVQDESTATTAESESST